MAIFSDELSFAQFLKHFNSAGLEIYQSRTLIKLPTLNMNICCYFPEKVDKKIYSEYMLHIRIVSYTKGNHLLPL